MQAGADGIPAGVLADRLGVPPSSMSFHLAQLANAGLVTQRRESRSIIYAADYGAMNGLMGLPHRKIVAAACLADDAASCEPSAERKSA